MTGMKSNWLRDVYNLEQGLTLFQGIRKEAIFMAFQDLLKILFREPRSSDKIEGAYHHLCSLLLKRTFSYRGPGDLWQDYLLDYLLGDENPGTLFLEQYPLEEMGTSLREALEGDLHLLQALFQLEGKMIKKGVKKLLNREAIPCWDQVYPLSSKAVVPKTKAMRDLFWETSDWRTLLPQLSSFFKEVGAGPFNQYYAFNWQKGQLQGISNLDPITFDEIIGYEEQKRALIANTQKLIRGLPSSNVLLYGDRGTGKSSSVKALLPTFGDQGLRLIQITGDNHNLAPLYQRLIHRKLSFILFMDDLSFNENDISFRDLKAILEGRIEPLPPQVKIYATSNLRHLLQETYKNKGDLVHPGDILQEEISLADRFGLNLIFSQPDTKTYLQMVKGLAERSNLRINGEDLRKKALTWMRRHSTPNGRTAMQLTQYLLGEQGLGGDPRRSPS